MSQPSLNPTARDFDAYAPDKATSNAYSRPRMEVKQRALAWARGVVARLAELGIAVDVHGSDEHPTLRNKKRVDCQWVFFWRDAGAREELERLLDQGRPIADVIDDPSPFTRHAFLALRIDPSAVEVCFAVHPEARVDVDNLRARLALGESSGDEAVAPPLTDELMRALAALPDEFMIGVAPEDRVACSSATPEAIRGMVERAAAGQVPLWIGWSVSRATALAHAETLGEQLEDAIVALSPIYRLVAWSRENDHIALDRRLEGVQRERARTHAEAEAQNERWRAEQAEARRVSLEQAKARNDEARGAPPPTRPGFPSRPSLATLFKSNAVTPRDATAPRQGRDVPKTAPSLAASPVSATPDVAPVAVAVPVSTPAAEPPPSPRQPTGFERGARVCVLSGAFAGKVGVIGALDGRGGARVLLGLLSTRLDLAALEPVVDGRERPALQSSHRRPVALPKAR